VAGRIRACICQSSRALIFAVRILKTNIGPVRYTARIDYVCPGSISRIVAFG
jgi:hypothetical protein